MLIPPRTYIMQYCLSLTHLLVNLLCELLLILFFFMNILSTLKLIVISCVISYIPTTLLCLGQFGSTDLALNAFADISYDIPYKLLKYAGIYGHAFVSAESHTILTDYKFLNFFLKNYFHSYRSYVGYGVVIPTKFFQMEVKIVMFFFIL